MKILDFVAKIGRDFIEILGICGRLFFFLMQVIKTAFRANFLNRKFFKQLIDIGYASLPVIALTACFTGAVLTLQTYIGFGKMSTEEAVASVVAVSFVRELGPVLSGLMIAGRVATSIASEIGALKVGEQINVLHVFGINPIKELAIPRIYAGIISMPILVVVADILGGIGSYLIAINQLNFNESSYLPHMFNAITFSDFISGVIKGIIFGLLITSIGYFFGTEAKGGAFGVGRVTNLAAVISSILVLYSDYIITNLLF